MLGTPGSTPSDQIGRPAGPGLQPGPPAPSRQVAGDRRWTAWLLTRALALLLGGAAAAMGRGNVFFDTRYYAHWAHGALTGSRIPYRDFGWEYPPGALPPMLLAGLAGARSARVVLWQYGVSWTALMLAVDAAGLRVLLRRPTAAGRQSAVGLWLWGLPLLGALVWARYDLLPACAAGLAVLAAGQGLSRKAGAWSGVGAALKLWPALMAPVQRTRRAAVGAVARAATVVGLTALATHALTGATGYGSVLSYQSRRGLQCESLAALPLLWLRHLHIGHYGREFRYGAWEVTGPHVPAVAATLTTVTAGLLAAVLLAHWRLMARDAGAAGVAVTAMAVTVVTLLTDKVLSPQYLVWLLVILAAAAMLDPETWRPYVPWALLASGLTAIEFPWYYGGVLGGHWFGLLVLTARDAVLVGLAVAVGRELTTRLHQVSQPLGSAEPASTT